MSNDLRWYSFENFGAPEINNAWGHLVDMLDACLVNGFGTQSVTSLTVTDGVGLLTFPGFHKYKQFQVIEISGAENPNLNAEFRIMGITDTTVEFLVDIPDQTESGTLSCRLPPLGWRSPFSGIHKRVYQAKNTILNPAFLRVDNSRGDAYGANYAKFAKVGILTSCTDIDDLTGVQAPFDPAAPNKNWAETGSGPGVVSGWFKWQYATHESTATSSSYYESEGATAGIRNWVLIGDDANFYFVIKTTVNTILEIPYGFGSVFHGDMAKSFLFATNRAVQANSDVLAGSPLSELSRVHVAMIYDYYNTVNNTNFGRLFGAIGNMPSGASTQPMKVDEAQGNILSPIYLADQSSYLIGILPIVRSCSHDATKVMNHSIYFDGNSAYIACRFRQRTEGVLGTIFFKIFDGVD